MEAIILIRRKNKICFKDIINLACIGGDQLSSLISDYGIYAFSGHIQVN